MPKCFKSNFIPARIHGSGIPREKSCVVHQRRDGQKNQQQVRPHGNLTFSSQFGSTEAAAGSHAQTAFIPAQCALRAPVRAPRLRRASCAKHSGATRLRELRPLRHTERRPRVRDRRGRRNQPRGRLHLTIGRVRGQTGVSLRRLLLDLRFGLVSGRLRRAHRYR